MERAVQLLVEIAGAEVVENGYDCLADIEKREDIKLRVSKTNDLLGMQLSIDDIAQCLESIELQVTRVDDDTLNVTIPSFRIDLEREIDLVEEVARLQGYNEIPTSMPQVPMSFPEQQKDLFIRKKLATLLTSQGFSEAINYSFVDKNYFDKLKLDSDDTLREAVVLLNPLSEDQNIMRTLLLPSLLQNIQRNTSRQNNDIRLFEIGKVFHPTDETTLPNENMRLAGVLSGRRNPASSLLHYGSEMVDIFDCKGAVEEIFRELRVPDVKKTEVSEANAAAPVYLQPDSYIRFESANQSVGHMGKVDTEVLRSFGIKQDLFLFDLDIDVITGLEPEPKAYTSLPRYPSVKWDIALVVPEKVPSGGLLDTIKNSGETLVESAEIFDIYQGKGIDKGHKSVALSITYRSAEQTLDDPTVNKVHQRLIKMLEERYDGKMREAG
jgi:phenylalanyl-tRNA synthetase beta chain